MDLVLLEVAVTVRTATLVVTSLSSTGNTDLVTVPAGETWILKSAHGRNAAGTTSDVVLFVNRPSVPASVFLFSKTTAAGEIFRFDGWVVLLPGDKIWTSISAQPVTLWLSGSRLTGVA